MLLSGGVIDSLRPRRPTVLLHGTNQIPGVKATPQFAHRRRDSSPEQIADVKSANWHAGYRVRRSRNEESHHYGPTRRSTAAPLTSPDMRSKRSASTFRNSSCSFVHSSIALLRAFHSTGGPPAPKTPPGSCWICARSGTPCARIHSITRTRWPLYELSFRSRQSEFSS
jgi:hypothetical protein